MQSNSNVSSELIIDSSLGLGAYAQVFHGLQRDESNWRDVAIKVMVGLETTNPKYVIASTEREKAAYEAIELARDSNKNDKNSDYLIKLYCFLSKVEVNSNLYPAFVIEYASEGDLYNWAVQKKGVCKEPYSIETVYRILCYISRAILFLHKKVGMLHRDIKPENILLLKQNKTLIAKLGDFGHTVKIGADGRVGSQVYAAPELYKDDTVHTEKTDMYAFGIMFYEVVTQQNAFQNKTPDSLQIHVESGERESIPESVLPKLKGIICNLWHQKPEERMNAESTNECLETPMNEITEQLKKYIPN